MKKQTFAFLLLAICVFTIFISLFLVNSYPHKASEKTRCIECRSNLEKIGIALKAYALDNDLFYPPYDNFNGLKLLTKYIAPHNLKCPLLNNKDSSKCDYYYRGGFKDNEPLKYICWDKTANHSKTSNKGVKNTVNVLFSNGYVGNYPEKSWEKMAEDYIASNK